MTDYLCMYEEWANVVGKGWITIVKIISHLYLLIFLSGHRQHVQIGVKDCHPYIVIEIN